MKIIYNMDERDYKAMNKDAQDGVIPCVSVSFLSAGGAKQNKMTKTEEFEKRQSEMSNDELIERAEKEVSELARTYGKSHIMCIPPTITDTDIILSELIRRFKGALVNER